uniref:CSON006867 protein n=1 Tax=Culicoides sonorensis TaxID=179676 RepID=A0A336M215_CULSO
MYDFTIKNPYCVSCYPTCDYLRYELQTTHTVIRDTSEINIVGANGPRVTVDPSRQSVIHVYYGDMFVKEFEQSMISTWYDLLSSLGGIMALITGGSVMTIVEITYLMTGRFGAFYVRKVMKRFMKLKMKREYRKRESVGTTIYDEAN